MQSSGLNGYLPRALIAAGVKPENIVLSPQIGHAINACFPDRASPLFSERFDILIGFVGGTEVSGWVNAISQFEGARAKVAFFSKDAAQVEIKDDKDAAALWDKRLRVVEDVSGEERDVFNLEDLAYMLDEHKVYAVTQITPFMNVPGISYDDAGVTAYTMVFQQDEQPIVIVDRLEYINGMSGAIDSAFGLSEGFESDYPLICKSVRECGPAAAHQPSDTFINASAAFPCEEMNKTNWAEGFLGLRLVSSRAYDFNGKPVDGFEVRGNSHRNMLAAAIACGWLRGAANYDGVNESDAKKAADRLARDAAVKIMEANALPFITFISACEGDRDGAATLPYGKVIKSSV